MTTAKLFISGFGAMIALAYIVAVLSLVGVTVSTFFLLLGIAGVSFLVGWGVDYLDTKFEIKDNLKVFLKEAFPELTIENMINKEVDKNKHDIDNLIRVSAMHGSGFFGF